VIADDVRSSGVNQTSRLRPAKSEIDPERTCDARNQCAAAIDGYCIASPSYGLVLNAPEANEFANRNADEAVSYR
jgi:hypothetical protein